MILLGIESSCDETSAAVIRDGVVLSNVVSSQIDLHEVYGGVVPEVASRQHLKIVDAVILSALKKSELNWTDLQGIGVTRGPGLPSALLVGVAAARGLATRLNVPLLPIHHMEAHLYSPDIEDGPFVALVVSGGHTLLMHVPEFGRHEILGQTVDDAAGEAFDKVARLLDLGYPGGPKIEKEARQGRSDAFEFPRPMLHSGDWNFSFSGLKTAVRRTLELLGDGAQMRRADLCASFQQAVVDVLIGKALMACEIKQTRSVAVSGGVACNGYFRSEMERRCGAKGIRVVFASRELCTDNAGMIVQIAEKKWNGGWRPPSQWDIRPDWSLADPD